MIDKVIVSRLLTKRIKTISRIYGGRNSFVYKVETVTGDKYLLKKYIKWGGDNRDRLVTEFKAFSFLWKHGVRNIPQPIYQSKIHNIGIYKYIAGEKIKKNSLTDKDIEQAIKFLEKLHFLSKVKEASKLPIASEACFTIRDYIYSIEKRFKKLIHLSDSFLDFTFQKDNLVNLKSTLEKFEHKKDTYDIYKNFYCYLKNDFYPFFQEVKQDVIKYCNKNKVNINQVLPRVKRILSPSDFGFHNALRSEQEIFFYDFEYFGWDDPAKLIVDIFLQPDFPLPKKYRNLFFKKIRNFLKDDKLVERLPIVYMLLSLKWCLIILNIFVRSSKELVETDNNVYINQLNKAEKKLRKAREEYKSKTISISLLF